MKFNIPAIVSQVANKITGQVDASPEAYVGVDFSDIGTQDDLVQKELVWLLDYRPVAYVYDRLVEQVLEHPEMVLCFEVAAQIVMSHAFDADTHNRERAWMEEQYRRDVL